MDKLTDLSQQLAKLLLQQQKQLAVAESCTGGWLAKTLTDVAGSSQWFERGFVSYSNAAKQEMLGVRPKTLLRDGAVSTAVVQEMALGALTHSQADISVAISGIAGPGGAIPGKPVGTVCFSWALKNNIYHKETKHFEGDREAVRLQAVIVALEGLLDVLGKS
jgi:nicotinamide-nucleotide amidase